MNLKMRQDNENYENNHGAQTKKNSNLKFENEDKNESIPLGFVYNKLCALNNNIE